MISRNLSSQRRQITSQYDAWIWTNKINAKRKNKYLCSYKFDDQKYLTLTNCCCKWLCTRFGCTALKQWLALWRRWPVTQNTVRLTVQNTYTVCRKIPVAITLQVVAHMFLFPLHILTTIGQHFWACVSKFILLNMWAKFGIINVGC